MRSMVWGGLALLGLVACTAVAPQPPRAPAAADAAPRGADSALVQRLYDYGSGFGHSRRTIGDRLGPPVETVAEPTQNRYVAAIDSVFELRYPGLSFLVYRVSADGRELLMSIWLTDPGHDLPGGIRVGRTDRAALLARVGPPAETDSAADTLRLWYQRPTEGAEEYVQFHTLRDTVRAVRWIYYVD